MTDHHAIDRALAKFFTNGRAEVGLEVGADPGLSGENYIRIPRSFTKASVCMVSGTRTKQATDTFATLRGQAGWEETGQNSIVVHDGNFYLQADGADARQQFTDIAIEAHTYDDIRKFIAANSGHICEPEIMEENIWWVHAVRFWTVVTGLVCGSKQTEWVLVEDPTGDLTQHDEVAQRIVEFQDNALTAAAARVASWRKTNHATGGNKAAGFPRRWLSKNGFWTVSNDRNAMSAANERYTKAFYIATHATCVHNALALMSPTDTNHWAKVNPKYGFLQRWDIRESTTIRMNPPDQVAGVAMVTDSMVVLRMLVAEGIYPMLESKNQTNALINAYATVRANGVRVASYASWFLDGHPDNHQRVPFNQKDATFSALVGELGAVARTYFKNSTIGESPALDNARQQLASETAKNRWSALARAKSAATNELVVRAYARVTGSATGDMFRNLASNDRAVVEPAVNAYNDVLTDISNRLGVADPVQIQVDDVMRTAMPEDVDVDVVV